jgi:hypothetical protein
MIQQLMYKFTHFLSGKAFEFKKQAIVNYKTQKTFYPVDTAPDHYFYFIILFS